MKRKQKNMIIARIVLSAMMVLFVGVQYVCASESALMSEYAYL